MIKLNKIIGGILIISIAFSCGETNFHEEFYPDGTLKSKLEIINGVNHGASIWYHPNGKLMGKVNFVNGKEEGDYVKYYDNGELKISTFFIDGMKNGELKEYSQKGKLITEQNYNQDRKDGNFKWYYLNGKLKEEATYENDVSIYSITFDSLGNWNGENRNSKINMKDTLVLNEEYDVTFSISGPNVDKIEALYGFRTDTTAYYDLDTNNLKVDLINNSIHYQFTASKVGKWQYFANMKYYNGYTWIEKHHEGDFIVIGKSEEMTEVSK